jgi:hypothetical protein
MLRYIPSIPSFLRAFIMKWCWISSKAFSASIEMIKWYLYLEEPGLKTHLIDTPGTLASPTFPRSSDFKKHKAGSHPLPSFPKEPQKADEGT